MDNKSKLFAFIPGESLLCKLDRIKDAIGLSLSEIARKAMGRGVEKMLGNPNLLPDATELEQLQCNERGSMLTLLRKNQDGTNLTRAEWSYLARVCNRTYDSLYHHIEVIDRELISDNLRAFSGVLTLRDVETGTRAHSDDHYYFGNMGFSWVDRKATKGRLQEHVEASVAGLPQQPFIGVGSFSSRNLDVALRDESILDINNLNFVLRPYLHSLLLVALRGYWEENKAPIITSADKSDGWPKNEEELLMPTHVELKRCANTHFAIEPVADETTIGVAVEAKHHPFIFALNNYVELMDFNAMLNRVNSANKNASMPGFEIHLMDFTKGKEHRFMLATGRWRHFFSLDEFEALKSVLSIFSDTPEAKAHLKKLESIYGRI